MKSLILLAALGVPYRFEQGCLIIAGSGDSGMALMNRPAAHFVTAAKNGLIDKEVMMHVWNSVVADMGASANYPGCIVFFCNRWIKRNQEGKLPPLPKELAPQSLQIKAASQIQVPKADETLEAYRREHEITKGAVVSVKLTFEKCQEAVRGLDDQIKYLRSQIVKYQDSPNKTYQSRIPEWVTQISEAQQLSDHYKDKLVRHMVLAAQALGTTTTTVAYEKETRELLAKLQSIHNGCMKDVEDTMDKTAKAAQSDGVATGSMATAGILDWFSALGRAIRTAWQRLANLELLGSRLEKLVNLPTPPVQ